MKNKILRRIVSFILLFTILTSFLPSGGYINAASSARPKASDIPTRTLIIGTHIISIAGLNSELLAIALDSANNTQQDKLYYKSEFADGTWFDISNSSSFADISTEGTAVENSVIDALTLTHWTKEDGKTYDLSNNTIVDIHKIEDPSNFSSLSELSELNTRREMLIETLKTEDEDAAAIDNSRKSSIERITLAPFSSANLDSIVKKMDSLENYINYLKDKKSPEDWINAAVKIKGEYNTLKYIECYYEVVTRLNNEILYLDTKVVDNDDKKVVSTELTTSYYSCLDAVNKKIAELETGITSTSASSYIDKERAKYSDALVVAVTKGTSAGFTEADTNLEKYMSIENIQSGLKPNIPLELSILKPLTTTISNALFSLSSAGAPVEYTDSKNAGESEVVLNSIKNAHIAKLDALVSELQSVIGYIKERDTDAANTESLLSSILSSCLSAISKVPSDDLKEGSTGSLKELLNWLNAELALIKQAGMDSGLIDKLKELDVSISALSDQYLSALDNRELDKANSLKEEIDALTDQKSDIYGNALTDQSTLLKQKSDLEAQLESALANGDSALATKCLDQLSTVNASLAIQGSATDELTASNNNSLTSLVSELKDLVDTGKYSDAILKSAEISELAAAAPTSSSTLQALLKGVLPTVTDKYNDDSNSTLNENYLKNIKDTIESLLNTASSQSTSGSGTSGAGTAASGTGTGNSGTGAGASGTGAGNSGTGTGASGTGAGASGTGAGASGTGAGASGTGAGASGTGSGNSGTGAGASGDNNADLLASLSSKIDVLLAQTGIDEDSSNGQLLKLVLLDNLGDTDEFIPVKSQIKSLQDEAATTLESLGSKYISYKHISSGGLAYISLQELSTISSRRYVWNAKTGTVSIARGSSTFVFSSNSAKVTINKKSKDMPAKAFFKGSVFYVPLAFIANELNFSWTSIGSSSKLLVYPKSIDTVVQKMLK